MLVSIIMDIIDINVPKIDTIISMITRYPGEYQEITKEKYEEAVKTAQKCIENTIKEIENTKNQTT
jgi:hypothetical protein